MCLLLLLSIDFWRLGLSLGCLITGTLPNGKHQPPFASCQQFRLPGILWIIKRPRQKPVARCEFPVPVPVPVMIPFVISYGWATMILITLQRNSSFDRLSIERSVVCTADKDAMSFSFINCCYHRCHSRSRSALNGVFHLVQLRAAPLQADAPGETSRGALESLISAGAPRWRPDAVTAQRPLKTSVAPVPKMEDVKGCLTPLQPPPAPDRHGSPALCTSAPPSWCRVTVVACCGVEDGRAHAMSGPYLNGPLLN